MKTLARPVRDFEWELWKQFLFPGTSILELGNKKNSIGVYKPWLEQQGYRHVSIDINGRDGALAFDLRKPVQPLLRQALLPATYDMLTNSGVIEHVETNQEMAWTNAYDLVKVGGVQIHVTPAAGKWQAHGLYHPKEEFFRKMASDNHMNLMHLNTYSWTPGKILTRCVLLKQWDGKFVYPGDNLLEPTPDGLELERRRGERT